LLLKYKRKNKPAREARPALRDRSESAEEEIKVVNTKFSYNSILCAPTICYTDNKGLSPALDLNGIKGLMLDKKHRETKGLNKEDVGNPLEFYVRSMLCACASTISIPAYGQSMWASR
jgi:hypothetical protein